MRLGYSEYGDPGQVVSLVKEKVQCDLQPGQVLAKYLLAPVNPADINVLQGKLLICQCQKCCAMIGQYILILVSDWSILLTLKSLRTFSTF